MGLGSASLLQHIELNSVIGALAETEAEQTTSTATDKPVLVRVATVKFITTSTIDRDRDPHVSSSFVMSSHSSRLDFGILWRTCESSRLSFRGTHPSPDFNNQSVHPLGFQPFSHSEGPSTNDTTGENIDYGCRLATVFRCGFCN
jgi:hypothetical protein